jgi:cyclic beta-1,2-glucan synthetase
VGSRLEQALARRPEHEAGCDALRGRLRDVAGRCDRLADAMDWSFLYDRTRGVFSIGFRLAAPKGLGASMPHTTTAGIGSPARELHRHRPRPVPQEHWFRLSRALVSVEGCTTLVSWSGSMFEYVMPLLILRSHPETLLENTCRAAVRARSVRPAPAVPWGISESAYHVVDAHGSYQYKAFGVPASG